MRRRAAARRTYEGQVAVVTGASSGIGRAIALALAARGALVVGVARRRALLEEVEGELASRSPGSTTRVCDVGDAAAYRDCLAALESGHGRIDVLVNNAGVNAPLSASAGGGDEAVRSLFDVNFFAVVTGTLAVLPGMVGRGSGIVLNVSSDAARAPEAGQGAYSASKAAVSAFSESVAHEVAGDGVHVHVHVLYPAWVPTAMGLAGTGEGTSLPPRPVRRSAEAVAALAVDRMGGEKVDLNAAALPLLAPLARTLAPVAYQRAMRRQAATRSRAGTVGRGRR